MKKIYLLLLSLICFSSYAQNTFPSSGNVGIGTTSPGAKLDVNSGTNSQFSSGVSARGAFSGNSNSFEWGHANTAGYGNTLGYYYSGGSGYLAFNGSAGTTINTFKTHGKKSSIILSDLAGGLQFGTVATAASTDNQSFIPLMSILGSGYVGIGTTSPVAKLDVNGNIKLPLNSYIQGNTGGASGNGGYLMFTGQAGSSAGYGAWLNQNAIFNGTNWIQPRGTLGSFLYTSNHHLGFSWQYAEAAGTNGAIITPTEVAKLDNSGSLTLNGNIKSNQGGTAALPKITLSGSTTTGIYTPIANGWGVSTNGLTALVIDATQKVGIGTSTPSKTLEVQASSANFNGANIIGVDNSYNYGYSISVPNQTVWHISSQGSGGTNIGNLLFQAGTTNRMIINNTTGHVGIGAAYSSSTDNISALYVRENSNSEYGLTVQNGGGNGLGINIKAGGVSSSSIPLRIALNNDTELMRINGAGNVGIGTTNPGYKLDVTGNLKLSNNLLLTGTLSNGTVAAWIDNNNTTIDQSYGLLVDAGTSSVDYNSRFRNASGAELVRITGDGKLGIGTSDIPEGYKMAVNGKIITEKVVVRKNENWPDFVFAKDYKLPELKDVEIFLLKNQHLPEIPTAKDIEKNGQDLAEMNRLLLKKVEELTLHLINQDKEIRDLKRSELELGKLKQEIKLIKSKLLSR